MDGLVDHSVLFILRPIDVEIAAGKLFTRIALYGRS